MVATQGSFPLSVAGCISNNTGQVYIMSMELTTLCLSITEDFLSQTQKSVMIVLCFRANQNHEVYSSIEKLALNCCCSTKTIERTLKQLRDKAYLWLKEKGAIFGALDVVNAAI